MRRLRQSCKKNILRQEAKHERKKIPIQFFILGFAMNFVLRYSWLFISGVILLIVGIFIKWCLYSGIALLMIDIIVSLAVQIKFRQVMISDSDDEQFRKFQDAVLKDGNVIGNVRNLVENAMEEYVNDEEE